MPTTYRTDRKVAGTATESVLQQMTRERDACYRREADLRKELANAKSIAATTARQLEAAQQSATAAQHRLVTAQTTTGTQQASMMSGLTQKKVFGIPVLWLLGGAAVVGLYLVRK